MKQFFTVILLLMGFQCYSWGFYAHRKINYHAVLSLPPEMLVFYKQHIDFLSEHAVDADKRRYALPAEAPRHYIDIDRYGAYPYDSLPRRWNDAVAKYGEDSLNAHGILPWWISVMMNKLTQAFRECDQIKILKYSADIGHYIADAQVPLHTSSNHNGQHTGQQGIHAFWESRIPELFAENQWNFFTGKAEYISNPSTFIWNSILESARASDSVLTIERKLSASFPSDSKYAFAKRNGIVLRQYSSAYCKQYDSLLNGMIERRMTQSIQAVASLWYTAWVNAGQPSLSDLTNRRFSKEDQKEFETLNKAWRKKTVNAREHE